MLLHQPQHRRYIAHLLYASPIQRGKARVIEDLVPLYRIPVEIRVAEKIKKALLIPGNTPLKLSRKDGTVKVIVPEFQCHCAIVYEY